MCSVLSGTFKRLATGGHIAVALLGESPIDVAV